VVFLNSARYKLHYTIAGDRIFQSQAKLVNDWPGDVYVYAGHLNIERARLFTADLSQLAGKIVMTGWMIKHPENGKFTGHSDLLREDAALFLYPDGEHESLVDSILLSIAENYGVSARANIVMRNEYGLIVTFRPDA
jgi:hypothetical protein